MRAIRKPSEVEPPRIEVLARLPIFYALEGRRALVSGGTAAAAWKAELLSAAGAQVEVFAVEVSDELKTIATVAPRGDIGIIGRNIAPDDFPGAAIAVAACADDAEAERFASMARSVGVPVNVIDKPAFSDFSFGAIVNRSPLVIGISTDGAAPVFGQAIRAKLEAMIPRGFSRWAEAARRWRPAVKASGLSFEARRRFWQLFTAQAIRDPNREPRDPDFQRLFEGTRRYAREAQTGSVTLVGAGPGDAELLTLRAVRALQSADVILIDRLVAPEVLEFARREAKKMMVGKTGGGRSCRQDDINALMISLAKAGRRVVRLKGGDPMIFGRAGEEIAACRAAGVACEIVPGISAAQGAASRLGLSLTDRRFSQRVQFVTGHDRYGGLPENLDWHALADSAATTVIYMPTRTLAPLAARMIAAGLDPSTPALVVAQATRPCEQVILSTIADLPGELPRATLVGPILVVVGRVVGEAKLGLPQSVFLPSSVESMPGDSAVSGY